MVCLLTSVAISSLSFGDTSLYIAYAVILAMTVGLFQIALALVRAGNIFDKIPEHVLLGFTSAAALIIATSQLSKVFGLPKISLNELLNISDLLNKTPISIDWEKSELGNNNNPLNNPIAIDKYAFFSLSFKL